MSGPQCSENPPNIVWSAFGKGSTVELGGLNTYVSGSSDSTLAILLISDVYGETDSEIFSTQGSLLIKLPLLDTMWWFQTSFMDKGFEDAKPVIEALKSHGISAIGAAGFCWGGKVVAKLAKSDYIRAAVLLHPTMVTVDDIKEVKVAIAILGAEFDKISPPKLLNQFEEVLYTKPEVDSFVKIYHGVSHGWSVRYKDEDEKEVKSAEEAHGDMIAWFNEHLKAKKRILAKF